MVVAETKSTSSRQHAAAESATLAEDRDRAFFSEPPAATPAFFQTGQAPTLQAETAGSWHPFFSSSRTPQIQAKCAACEAEEQEEEQQGELPELQRMTAAASDDDDRSQPFVQRQPAFESEESPVQTKLTVGRPGDRYEQEADQIASQVMQMPAPTLKPRQRTLGVVSPLSISSVQRKCAACTAEEEQPNLQKQGDGAAAQPHLESRLLQSKGKGQPLPDPTRSFMESRFGHDFSAVRVHTGSDAVQMNQDLGAQAFTHQQDVYFGAGKYQPESDSGKRLLAHELTHTVQQGQGGQSVQRLECTDLKTPMPCQRTYTRLCALENAGLVLGVPVSFAATSILRGIQGDVYDIRGQQTFSPSVGMMHYMLDYFERFRTNRVPLKVKYGSLGLGTILLEADEECSFSTTGKFLIGIDHPGLQVNPAEKAIALEVEVRKNQIFGSIGVPKMRTGLDLKQNRDIPQISYGGFDPEALYPVIFGEAYTGDNFAVHNLESDLQNGLIHYFVVGILDVQHQQKLIGGLAVVDDFHTWKGELLTRIIGTDNYQLPIARTPTGYLSGDSQDLKLDGKWSGAGFTVAGGLHIVFANKSIEVTGTASYKSDRAQGSVTIAILPESKAQATFRQHIPAQPCPLCQSTTAATAAPAPASPTPTPANPAPANPVPAAPANPTAPAADTLADEPLALTAWGNAHFKLIDKAKTLGGEGAFVVDPEGHIITAGQLKLQKDFVLMDALQKDYVLFEGEIATQLIIFEVPVRLRISGDIKVGYQIGPVVMYELTVSGGYSNHPEHKSELCLGAKFEMPANLYAALNLVAAAAVAADFKLFDVTLVEVAGVLSARTDLNAYLNAQPSIGVSQLENQAPEYCLAGKLAIGGDLTVALGTDFEISVFRKVKTSGGGEEKRQLGKKDSFGSWTLGDFGFELDVSYILGSGETPEFSYAGKQFDKAAFIRALKKGSAAATAAPKLRGGFTQDGEQRGVVDNESIKDREVDESNNPLGPFELVESFTMNGTPHKLYLVVAGTEGAPTAVIEMESDRQALVEKIDAQVSLIQIALASATLHFSDEEIAKLQAELGRLGRLRAKTLQVTQSVIQNLADPEHPTDIAAPGFETLDDDVGDFGDQFGVSDLGQSAAPSPAPGTPTPSPDGPPPGQQIRLVLPPQKAIHRGLYQQMIREGPLQHSLGRAARDTNQQTTWDRIITAAMPRGTYCRGRGLSLEPVDILRPYWSKQFLDASRRSRRKPKAIDPSAIPRMQVDHVIEWQVRPLVGGNWVDQPWNFELLDPSSNGSSGPKMDSNIQQERERLRNLTGDDTWLTKDITFTEVQTAGSASAERWSSEEIEDGDHLDTYRRLTAEPVDKDKERTC